MSGRPVLLDTFRGWVADAPGRPALGYFDTVLTYAEVDAASDALAAVYLQNVPQYVITMLAVWKLGGAVVPVNPMLTPGEVAKLIDDATPRVLVALDELCGPELFEALRGTSVLRVITTTAFDVCASNDGLGVLIAPYRGRRPERRDPDPSGIAVITYTSGTTGKPKDATNTHGNIAAGGRTYTECFVLGAEDTVLGIAPLFHVTGLTGHIVASITAGSMLLLCNRCDPGIVLDAVHRHRPTFTVGALTAFIALLESGATREDLASLTTIASGGAPVAAGVLERFRERFGTYLHNVYGMTEITSPC